MKSLPSLHWKTHVYLFLFCFCFQPIEHWKWISQDSTYLIIVVGRTLEEWKFLSCVYSPLCDSFRPINQKLKQPFSKTKVLWTHFHSPRKFQLRVTGINNRQFHAISLSNVRKLSHMERNQQNLVFWLMFCCCCCFFFCFFFVFLFPSVKLKRNLLPSRTLRTGTSAG